MSPFVLACVGASPALDRDAEIGDKSLMVVALGDESPVDVEGTSPGAELGAAAGERGGAVGGGPSTC